MLNDNQTQGKVVCESAAKKINLDLDPSRPDTRMSLYEFSRWNCLLEAVDIIDQKAHEINDNSDSWVKPIAIQKYIDERTPSMLHELAIKHDCDRAFVPAG